MRFGLQSPPPAAPLPINLAADDSADSADEEDADLQRPRPFARARPPRGRPREAAGLPTRKRSLEQASLGGGAASSSSDDSGAEATRPRVSALEAATGRRSFTTPSPLRIARRKKEGLHFFMDAGSRQRVLRDDGDAASVCAARALICSQRFGRCEVRFGDSELGLRLWTAAGDACAWQGGIKYGQLARCWYVAGSASAASSPIDGGCVRASLSSGERAPYLLLLEIEASAKGHTAFAELFDPLFARWSQDHADVRSSRTSARQHTP